MKKPIYYLSQVHKCDVCQGDFVGGIMADCRMRANGWANCCVSCWVREGRPVGTGRGQVYALNPLTTKAHEKWVCIAGGEGME